MSEESTVDMSSISEMGSNIDPSIAKFILSFGPELDDLKLSWEGKDIDYSTDPPTVDNSGFRLMNKEGVSKVISFLKSIIGNKGIPMSNFHKDQPYNWSCLQGMRLAKDIFVNMREYEIPSTEDADRIIFPSLLIYQAHILRGSDGGERTFMKGFMKEKNVVGNQKGKGLGLT